MEGPRPHDLTQEYESKAQALADCSFDEAMEYVEDPTAHYIGEAKSSPHPHSSNPSHLHTN